MSNQSESESTNQNSDHHRDSIAHGESPMADRLSRISTQANLVLNEQTTDAERTKLYFKYAIAFETFLRQHLKQDPPPADISDAIWKKFMKMKFEHRGPGSFRKYLDFVLNSSIATYQARRQKLQVNDMLDLQEARNTRIELRKRVDKPTDHSVSYTTHVPPEESESGPYQGAEVSEDFDHYTKRLEELLQQNFPAESLSSMLASEGDIKSMVRGVLQTICWERLNQIGQESRRLDQEAKESGKKKGDSRWRYILATQTCAQLRIDCDRSTADVEKLVLRLATLVGQSNLSGDLAKKWASRGSQLYAGVIIECAAEMFDTQDRESLAAELADLGLLNIKFIKDALQNKLDSEE